MLRRHNAAILTFLTLNGATTAVNGVTTWPLDFSETGPLANCLSPDMGTAIGCCMAIAIDYFTTQEGMTPAQAGAAIASYTFGSPAAWAIRYPNANTWTTDTLKCGRVNGWKGALVQLQIRLGFSRLQIYAVNDAGGNPVCRIPYSNAIYAPAWNNVHNQIPLPPPGQPPNYEGGTFFKDVLVSVAGPLACGVSPISDAQMATEDLSSVVAACQDDNTKCSTCVPAIINKLAAMGSDATTAFETWDLMLINLVVLKVRPSTSASLDFVNGLTRDCSWGSDVMTDASAIFRYVGIGAKAPVCYTAPVWIPSAVSGMLGYPPPPVNVPLLLVNMEENGTRVPWLMEDGTCPTPQTFPIAVTAAENNCNPPPFIIPCTEHSQCAEAQLCFDGVCMCDFLTGWTGVDAPFYGTECSWQYEYQLFSKQCDIKTQVNYVGVGFIAATTGVTGLTTLITWGLMLYTMSAGKAIYKNMPMVATLVLIALSTPFICVTWGLFCASFENLGAFKNTRIAQQMFGILGGISISLEKAGLQFLFIVFSKLLSAEGGLGAGLTTMLYVWSALAIAIGAGYTMYGYISGKLIDAMIANIVLDSQLVLLLILFFVKFQNVVKAAKMSEKMLKTLKAMTPFVVSLLFMLPIRLTSWILLCYATLTKQVYYVSTVFFAMSVATLFIDWSVCQYLANALRTSAVSASSSSSS